VSYLKISMKDNFSAPLMKKLQQAGPRAAHAVAVQIESDTEPFVPASGAPAGMYIRTQVVDSSVIYPGPSARMLREGKLMIDPNTGSVWARKGATKVVTGKDLKFNHSVHSKAQSHWDEASKAQNLDKWVRVAGRAMDRELDK
jgi:hypothetical protein